MRTRLQDSINWQEFFRFAPRFAGRAYVRTETGPAFLRTMGSFMDNQLMRTHLMRCDGSAVLAVSGEIDMSVVDDFTAAIAAAIDGTERSVQLDLRGVDYLDSCGCHCLVNGAKQARAHGVDFRVVHVSPRAQRVIRLLGLVEALQAPHRPAV
jgi:anti-sigma B factor antagonist